MDSLTCCHGNGDRTAADDGQDAARDWVDKQLEQRLAAIAQLSTKKRDLPCRYFASAAAQVGRPDMGFAAIKLPGPAVRRYAASDMVCGAAASLLRAMPTVGYRPFAATGST